jgi:DNA-binding XRE family transcriptional regulator
MLRAERGISRRQLSEALGVHYQTIGYLERGEYSPSLYLALKIAEYSGCRWKSSSPPSRSPGWGVTPNRAEGGDSSD